jgi:hypothetical protein
MNKMTNRVQLLTAMLLGACGAASAAPVYRYVDCTACAARIPDSNGSTDGLVVAAITVPSFMCSGTTVQAYALQLEVLHSRIGDLKVKLTSPLATSVTLVNRPQVSGNCAGDDIVATFADAGASAVCGTKIPALGGDVKPSGIMATLGTALQPGVWLVETRDQAAGGDGYLADAQLRMTCGYSDGIFTDSFERP